MSIGTYLTALRWVDERVLAAGQLRQGTAPSIIGMVTGHALIELLRPRRCKLLRRSAGATTGPVPLPA